MYVHAGNPQARGQDANRSGPAGAFGLRRPLEGEQRKIIKSDAQQLGEAQQLGVSVDPIPSFEDTDGEWDSALRDSPAASIFLSPQWQQVWWASFGAGREMAGFSAPGGVASLCRTGGVIGFVGSPDTFDYNDFLARPGMEEVFYRTLLDVIEGWEWDTLKLDSLIEDSPTLAHLPDLARGRGYAVAVEYEDVTSGVTLPPDWDRYLALLTKKDRHELRRKQRRLDSQTQWRGYCLRDPGEAMAAFDDFLALMRMSRADKDDYMTAEREGFFRAIGRRMAELDRLRLFFMEIDGRRAAASLCFDYRGARLLYNSGYDPEFSYYSVGLLLHAMCVKDAIESGLEYFDFLRGPEPYKAHLGGRQKSLYRMVVQRS